MMTNKTLEELEMDKIVAHRASMHRVNNGLVSLEQAIKSACLEYAQAQNEKIAELQGKLDEAIQLADLNAAQIGAIKHSVVSTIGGTVEGNPTHYGNYLQRLRELTAAESRVKELQTKLTETNERLMARELLLTQQHDDLVKLESRVRELERVATKIIGMVYVVEHERAGAQLSGFPTGWEHPNTQATFAALVVHSRMEGDELLKSAQQPKEHHEG